MICGEQKQEGKRKDNKVCRQEVSAGGRINETKFRGSAVVQRQEENQVPTNDPKVQGLCW